MHKHNFCRLLSLAAGFAACFAILVYCTSCSKKPVWYDDLTQAKAAAEKQNKNIFLFFSGEDWDEKTSGFKTSVLSTSEFMSSVGKKYVLANLDLSQAQYASTIGEENTSEKSKALQKKRDIIQQYGVVQIPVIYLLSKEGYVLSIIHYNESMTSVSALQDVLSVSDDNIQEVSACIDAVNSSSGTDKVRAIDSLYEATISTGRYVLAPLVSQVASLDINNETGLVGKYEFITTYNNAVDKFSLDETAGIAESFAEIAETGHLDPIRKQEAYYNAAFIMAVIGDSDYDTMYGYLQKALAQDTQSEHAEDISLMMESVLKMKSAVEQARAAMQSDSQNSTIPADANE